MIWHAGFPLLVFGYALLKDPDGRAKVRTPAGRAILTCIIVVGAAISALSWIVTARHGILPILLSGGHYTSTMIAVVSMVWALSLAGLLALWFRRPHSVIDVWLMVVLCAWLFDIALSAIFNVNRFDLGFYAGRIYGLCAASFVLAVLLVDNVGLQAQLARLLGTLRRQVASDRERHNERDRLFTAVVESSKDAIITKTLDGTITGWNRAAERLFGFTAIEAVGQRIDIIVPPDGYPEMQRILRQIGSGHAIENHETLRQHKDGHPVYVELSISPIRSLAGEIIGASKIARDLGESKRTQQALNQEIEERRRIFETSQDLILVTDTKGTFVQVSPSSMTILDTGPKK